jgi:hypothetical protein
LSWPEIRKEAGIFKAKIPAPPSGGEIKASDSPGGERKERKT